jgi:hypothetical protein
MRRRVRQAEDLAGSRYSLLLVDFEAYSDKYYRPSQFEEDLQAKIHELTARIRDLESALAALQVCFCYFLPSPYSTSSGSLPTSKLIKVNTCSAGTSFGGTTPSTPEQPDFDGASITAKAIE